jgi:hypothetical protein
MTIGEGESNRYIVINPRSRKFESNNPGALYVVLYRAKTAGGDAENHAYIKYQQQYQETH